MRVRGLDCVGHRPEAIFAADRGGVFAADGADKETPSNAAKAVRRLLPTEHRGRIAETIGDLLPS